jgi:hypothetical protein
MNFPNWRMGVAFFFLFVLLLATLFLAYGTFPERHVSYDAPRGLPAHDMPSSSVYGRIPYEDADDHAHSARAYEMRMRLDASGNLLYPF